MPVKGSRSAAKAGGNTAPSRKTRPPGLGGQKGRDATVGLWELEDERQLVRIACFKLRVAVAMKVKAEV